VAEINMVKLKSLNQPIAAIKACHYGGAQTLSSDEMGGLEPVKSKMCKSYAYYEHLD